MKVFVSFTILAVFASSVQVNSAGIGVKVIGGQEATPNEFPFVVSIRIGNGTDPKVFKCAGALISQKHVLISAHCLTDGAGDVPPLENFQVVAGDHKLGSPDDGEKAVGIAMVDRYPNWSNRSNGNDIAVIELTELLPESDKIRAISLPDANKVLPYTVGQVVGWGQNETAALTDVLKKAELTVTEGGNCQKRFESLIIEGRHFCAGSEVNAAYIGDEGAPFVTGDAASRTIYGLVWHGTGEKDVPGSLFTRVGASLCWIKEAMGEEPEGDCIVTTTTTEATTTTTENSHTTTTTEGSTPPTTTGKDETTTAGSGMIKYNALAVLLALPLLAFR